MSSRWLSKSTRSRYIFFLMSAAAQASVTASCSSLSPPRALHFPEPPARTQINVILFTSDIYCMYDSLRKRKRKKEITTLIPTCTHRKREHLEKKVINKSKIGTITRFITPLESQQRIHSKHSARELDDGPHNSPYVFSANPTLREVLDTNYRTYRYSYR